MRDKLEDMWDYVKENWLGLAIAAGAGYAIPKYIGVLQPAAKCITG